MNDQRVHRLFTFSVMLKGVHALVECLGGIALALVSTGTIVGWVNRLTAEELIEDPHDLIARHALDYAQHFSISSQHFYAWYLLSHGLVKLFLVFGLLRGQMWAYPASILAMFGFIIYQLYRYVYTGSVALIALTIFDLLVIWLVLHEYRLVRRRIRSAFGPSRT